MDSVIFRARRVYIKMGESKNQMNEFFENLLKKPKDRILIPALKF